MFTSTEAARASGVSPSTFRAYVARGQAPKPREKAGGVNLWSVTDLAGWRDLSLSPRERHGVRADVAILHAQGKDWEDSTRRHLAQIGIGARDAQSLIDGITVADMDTQTYRDARLITTMRRSLKRRLHHALGAAGANEATEESILASTGLRVAAGQDTFEALSEMTFSLVTAGYPERLLPVRYDGRFWLAQDDEAAFTQYLADLDRADVPEVV